LRANQLTLFFLALFELLFELFEFFLLLGKLIFIQGQAGLLVDALGVDDGALAGARRTLLKRLFDHFSARNF